MKRVRVGYYVHEWNYAGTARSHERIIAGLDETSFEPFVFYWNSYNGNTRLDAVRKLVESKNGKMVPFSRSEEKTGPEQGYTPLSTNFHELVESLGIDVMHVGRGGHYEWPFERRICPVQVETNIFGDKQKGGVLDWSLPISDWVMSKRGSGNRVVYNPIPDPVLEGDNLRAALKIPEDAIVCGRIGRPGNWSNYGLHGFRRIHMENPNSYYVIISPCPEDIQLVKENTGMMNNVILLDSTSDDSFIEKFHRTIDIFLHYRADGETFGTAIAQAMSYGIPVVSHDSRIYGAQREIIGSGGFVASSINEYVDYSLRLIDVKEREIVGAQARAVFLKRYQQDNIARQYEREYLLALRSKSNEN